MHERYLFPALSLALLSLAYVKDKRLLFLFAGFSLTLFLNQAFVLKLALSADRYDLPAQNLFLRLMSLVNIAMLIYAAKVGIDLYLRQRIGAFDCALPDRDRTRPCWYSHGVLGHGADEYRPGWTIRDYIFCISIFIIILLSFSIRFYHLDLRPFHSDGGVNGFFTLKLLKEGIYQYNPDHFHGPLLYYLTLIPFSLFGPESSLFPAGSPALSDISFRIAPALLGSIIVVLILTLRKRLGRTGTIAAMILLAISPSFLYFSRDNIREIYLITFTLTTFVCGYHYVKSKNNICIYLTLISLALMFTVKETAGVTAAIWAFSLALTVGLHLVLTAQQRIRKAAKQIHQTLFQRLISPIPIAGIILSLTAWIALVLFQGKLPLRFQSSWWISLSTYGLSVITLFIFYSLLFENLRNKTKHVLVGSLLFFFVISIFFSSFFTYSQGIASFFKGFESWFWTGTASSYHDKPFFYFLGLLLEYESPILILGCLVIIFMSRKADPVTTFVAFWTGLAFPIYSAIPYKTPWLVLNIVLPLALLAGKCVQNVRQAFASGVWRAALPFTSVVILLGFAHASIDLSFVKYDNDAHEVVYVQTFRDAKKLIERIFELTKKYSGPVTEICVTSPDHWPLPWYLRDYTQTSWSNKIPEKLDAPIILATTDQESILDTRLQKRYEKEHYRFAPGVPMTLYYQKPKGRDQ